VWRSVTGPYVARRAAAATTNERIARLSDAVRYLATHIHQAPVHVIPCLEGRTDHAPVVAQASRWGSIIPAAWSFMLAARPAGWAPSGPPSTCAMSARGGRPAGDPVRHGDAGGLIPVTYSVGTDFRPPPASCWTRWSTGTSGRRLGGGKTHLPGRLSPPHRGGRDATPPPSPTRRGALVAASSWR
jgi:hypothetical protein